MERTNMKKIFFLSLISIFLFGCKDYPIDLKNEDDLAVLNKCYSNLILLKEKDNTIEVFSKRQEEFEECLKNNKYDFKNTLKKISDEIYKKEDKDKIYKVLGNYFVPLNRNPNWGLKDFSSVFSTEEINFINIIEGKMEEAGDTHPSKVLMAKLENYKNLFEAKDFITLSSLIYPVIIQENGGTEAFVNEMKKLMSIEEKGTKLGKLSTDKIGRIENYKNFSFSVIPMNIYFNAIDDNKPNMQIKMPLIAFSENKGEDWSFFWGEDKNKIILSKNNPDILAKMILPQVKMEVSSGNKKIVLLEKNGEFIETKNTFKEILGTLKDNVYTFQAMLETYGTNNAGHYTGSLDELKKQAIKGGYWKELINPYNKENTEIISLNDYYSGNFGIEDKPGLIIYKIYNCEKGGNCVSYNIWSKDDSSNFITFENENTCISNEDPSNCLSFDISSDNYGENEVQATPEPISTVNNKLSNEEVLSTPIPQAITAKNRKVTLEQEAEILKLFHEGQSVKDISKKLLISRTTISEVINGQ
jgi:hypothetical protein